MLVICIEVNKSEPTSTTAESQVKKRILSSDEVTEGSKRMKSLYSEREACQELKLERLRLHMNEMVGQFLQLPRFEVAGSDDILPKAYLKDTKFFFSSQHGKLMEALINNESEVRVIIGPHGIGKSHLQLLIASFAFVNRFCLVYIPQCAKWAQAFEQYNQKWDSNVNASLYFLKIFKLLNSDIVDEDFMNSIDVALYQDNNMAPHLFARVLELKNLFIVLDDHNELWNYHVSEEPFFRMWSKWSVTPRNTFISGSAHSEYLATLSAMPKKQKYYVIPFLKEDGINFIKDRKSPCYLPDYIDNPDRLERLTNFVPRYMRWLKESKDEDTYVKETIANLEIWARRFFLDLTDQEKRLYVGNLKHILFGDFTVDSYIFDSGFIYQEDGASPPIIVNSLIQRVIAKLYAVNAQLLPVLDNQLPPTEKGHLLEEHLILRAISGPITLQCRFTGNTDAIPVPLNYEVQQIVQYRSKNRGYVPFVANREKCTIYIPHIENNFFPFIDHFVRRPDPSDFHKDLIIFNSATLSPILEHMYNSEAKKKYELGELQKFLDPMLHKETVVGTCSICRNKDTADDEETSIDWIQCDNCLCWYHLNCIGRKTEKLPKDEEGYICEECQKSDKDRNNRKVQRAEIVQILNAVYGVRGHGSFGARIFETQTSSNGDDKNYNFEVFAYDGKKMENIVILYSCGRKLHELTRTDSNIDPNKRKFINDFPMTDIHFCTQEDHVEQLNIPYYSNQPFYFRSEISIMYKKFLN